jgi:squalene-hopene/tetraprenyl-beta-curcumene cyclase
MRRLVKSAVLGITAITTAAPALALDEAHYRDARAMIEDAIAYLRTQQDEATGGWLVRDEGPQLPAITGLVLSGMLMEPQIDSRDETVQQGLDFILSFRQPDGGVYDRILASYNTSICLSALARANTAESGEAIKPAQDFLRSLQWSEDSNDHAETGDVTTDHPFYGGIGYGSHGRPDNSNLNMMLQAMHDSGLSCDDPAFQRAITFLERTQMHHNVNDMDYAAGSTQGGFIYATGPESDQLGVGESKAGMMDETLADGMRGSRLRCYGSMTYAGFKSYIYANLDRDDERVQLAYDWIRTNYTLEENPGVGMQGLYYYFVTFSRALDAWGLPYIETTTDEGGDTRDWANDLIDRLSELQNPDGSFKSVNDRWMEGESVMTTAYALLALQHAIN